MAKKKQGPDDTGTQSVESSAEDIAQFSAAWSSQSQQRPAASQHRTNPAITASKSVVINPPYGLEAILRGTAPLLARHLAVGPGAVADVGMMEPVG